MFCYLVYQVYAGGNKVYLRQLANFPSSFRIPSLHMKDMSRGYTRSGLRAKPAFMGCQTSPTWKFTNADVFDGMVGVNPEIPFRHAGEIKAPVPRHCLKHMVKKRNAGAYLCGPPAVKSKPDADLCFLRVA